MKAVKITNPNWLVKIAPRIAEYNKIVSIPGMTYELLYSYFAQSVQFSGGACEFWVVFDNNEEPVAFAHWMTRGLPFSGKALFDHLYKWSKSKKPLYLLFDQFKDFYLRMRCTMADAAPINEQVTSLLTNYGKELGWEVSKKEYIYLTMNFYPEQGKDDG